MTVMMDDLILFFNSSWAGQLNIVDFSVVTPNIPDSPPKEKSESKHRIYYRIIINDWNQLVTSNCCE